MKDKTDFIQIEHNIEWNYTEVTFWKKDKLHKYDCITHSSWNRLAKLYNTCEHCVTMRNEYAVTTIFHPELITTPA